MEGLMAKVTGDADMAPACDSGGGGRVSAVVRVDGDLRSIATDFPARSVFPIYSITKTLTAICVLRLVETGSLRLVDDARQWLPELGIPVTISLTHLLRHTSGLRDYGPLSDYHDAVRAHPDRPWTRRQFLDAVLPHGLRFAPGEGFSYSNVGYMLLIDIVERVTGQTFAQVVDHFITRPLALQDTSVLERVDDLMRCVPGFGSEVTSDGRVVDVRGRYHPGWCAPRLIASTVEDVTLVFDRLIAGDLLDPETLAHMLTLAPLSDQPDENHSGGMGVYADHSSKWGHSYHHGGGGPGYDLGATVYTDTRLGRVAIAVFVDSSCGPRADDCEQKLIARLIEEGV
jgi:D-alanyl-D-alanine carboxypeptidase